MGSPQGLRMIYRNTAVPPDLEPKIDLYSDLLEERGSLFLRSTKRWFLLGLPIFALWLFLAEYTLKYISVTLFYVLTVFCLPALITWAIRRKRAVLQSQMSDIQYEFQRKGLSIAHDPGSNISVDKWSE